MMNIKAKRDIAHKTKILNHARESKNIAKTCRHFGISRETFYTWKRAYERDGETIINPTLKIQPEELQNIS
ncbi:helix-turn-helix protein [Providencia alcalifaciens]|uniref:Helix-turn-helix protein n=1 Tax=Providencia alcalifaciens TaxID=126385 RepID=A0A4V2V323_9GAMM|nr:MULTISPECIES: helix-turn-helix domain-containing protein [Providencia]TCT28190.1 helix-turn-helix protein [Providencia alcalifaciens]